MDATCWALGCCAALMVGFSKTGVPGLGILIVPIMAGIFPAKLSVGALLPMLIVGDVFAVAWYRRRAQWDKLLRLLPYVFLGMIPGTIVLWKIDEKALKPLLGGLVLALLAVQLVRWRFKWTRMPRGIWFTAAAGIMAGFATTVGNVAGPIMGIYLISAGLSKDEFIGTGAWYYLTVNTCKVPIFSCLGIITAETLGFDAAVAPAIVIGALVGRFALPSIPVKTFNAAILILAAIGALRLILL